MAKSDFEIVIVGGGAAGIAAGRRLHDAGVDCVIVEARDRLGGRAWTVNMDGHPIDLGCGWLHSADENPWTGIAEAQGLNVDHTPPPWMRPSIPINFPPAEQSNFRDALLHFFEKQSAFPENAPDVPAASLLEPHERWNRLIGAVSTFLSGAEPEKLSARDFARYHDTGVNWRVVEGYGATILAHADGVPIRLGSPVRSIDHTGRRIRIGTADGTITADSVIVTLPSNLIAEEAIRFTPALREKVEAAAALPLGINDKLFLSLDDAEEFETDSRLFGRIDRTAIAAYHFRPFGRPQIEAYFGGSLAAQLEEAGEQAFFEFALAELTSLLGSQFAGRLKPLQIHRWGTDPYARGAYSHALVGKADCRGVLAAPVDRRLFFAGEACSVHSYSTAHGAYLTGIEAADHVIAARRGITRQLKS
jgi:monoamine oxidase